MRKMLPGALGVDPVLVNAAIEKTGIQQARWARERHSRQEFTDRRRFTPQIMARIDIHKRKAPVAACLWLGGSGALLIDVPPGLPTQAEKVQLAMVRSIMENYPNTEDGELCSRLFGNPTHYIYRPTYDDAWEFSPDLDLVRKVVGPVVPAGGSIRIANKQIIDGHITPCPGR